MHTSPFILLRSDSIVWRQLTESGLSRISFSLESHKLRRSDCKKREYGIKATEWNSNIAIYLMQTFSWTNYVSCSSNVISMNPYYIDVKVKDVLHKAPYDSLWNETMYLSFRCIRKHLLLKAHPANTSMLAISTW